MCVAGSASASRGAPGLGVFAMTRILLTNDDGIHSDGLIKLEESLKSVGDV